MQKLHHGDAHQHGDEAAGDELIDAGPDEENSQTHRAHQCRPEVDGVQTAEEAGGLFHGLNGLFRVAHTEKVLPLSDEDGHGDTGGKAGGDGVGDEADQTAQLQNAHQDQDDARHDGGEGQPAHAVLRHDARHNGGKGGGGARDLHPAAAEEGDQEARDNGGVDALLRADAAGQRQRDGKGQCDDGHDDARYRVLGELLAGIGFQAGAEKLGAMVIPMGPGNTDKQLQMMIDLESTVLTATSSYALLLAEEIDKRGLKDKIHLKKGVFGSERWSEKKREYIKEKLGIELYDIYGLTEIYGPGIGISCDAQNGMHYWDDYVYIEIIDPKTGKTLPDGEEGEIVITTLVKEGAPLIRFRTHDISRIIPGECPCGRKHPRLDIIKGRSDDMFKVHGVNMFPSQVEELLALVDGVPSEYTINIAHDEPANKDIMLVTVEAEGRVDFEQTGRQIRDLFKSRIGVTPKITVVPVGTLPRSEKKTQRVIDHREQ